METDLFHLLAGLQLSAGSSREPGASGSGLAPLLPHSQDAGSEAKPPGLSSLPQLRPSPGPPALLSLFLSHASLANCSLSSRLSPFRQVMAFCTFSLIYDLKRRLAYCLGSTGPCGRAWGLAWLWLWTPASCGCTTWEAMVRSPGTLFHVDDVTGARGTGPWASVPFPLSNFLC